MVNIIPLALYCFLSANAVSIPLLNDTTIQLSQEKSSEIGLESSEFTENEENTPVDNPTFPLLSAFPSFSNINLPLPNFPNINIQNPFAQRLPIKATKTEYIEITRRQTIHPVCYSSLKRQKTCLPYHNQDEKLSEIDDGMSLQIETESNGENAPNLGTRDPKYLEFAKKEQKNHTEEIEPSIVPQEAKNPFQRVTEWETKTVLITRVERYTDHRVTATLIAKNCIPVNPNIPKCHSRTTTIIDTPDHLIADGSANTPVIIASVVAAENSNKIMAAMEAINAASQAFVENKLSEKPTVVPLSEEINEEITEENSTEAPLEETEYN